MENIEVVVSYDTTGSMYPCITQVRREVEDFARTLFRDIQNFRMGVIAHGDYCDARTTYVYKQQDITDDRQAVMDFIRKVGDTYGGDTPECYELVLHNARSLKWTAGEHKVLVLVGDDVPHNASYPGNTQRLDWRNEARCLAALGVKVYAVQALNRRHATDFYKEVARITGGYYLTLSQFSEMPDLIRAICYQQAGPEQLRQFETQIKAAGRMNRNMMVNFSTLSGKRLDEINREVDTLYGKKSALAALDGRFQVLNVDEDIRIDEFCRFNGLKFKPGRGFYQFTKSVEIQPYKEVIVQDKVTGDIFTGDEARRIAGIPIGGGNVHCFPTKEFKARYLGFVQSTSYNRKLLGGTKFLYEIEDYEK